MRRAGYNTRPFLLVGEVLSERKGAHMTAEEIVNVLYSRGEKIGLTTVYRNLEKLISQGKVRKFTGGDSACFSYVDEGCHHHFHLKCVSCGRLIHLECEHIDLLSAHIADEHGFSVDKSKTVLYGTCKECAR